MRILLCKVYENLPQFTQPLLTMQVWAWQSIQVIFKSFLLDSNFLYQMLYTATYKMLNLHPNSSIKAILVTHKHRQLKESVPSTPFSLHTQKLCLFTIHFFVQPLTPAKTLLKMRTANQDHMNISNLEKDGLNKTVT